jgi:CRISPR-associated protein Csc3
MDLESLRSLPWLNDNEIEEGRFSEDKYAKGDLPFLATIYTTTRGKTTTEAWIEPAFLALSLPLLLGVKVIATSSFVPLYNSDRDFLGSTILDGPAGFWNLLNLPTSLRIQDFSKALEKLLVAYSLHLDTRSSPPDARWQDLIKTVREVMTNVLNVFALANEKLREDKREASPNEVYRFWNYAQIFSQGDELMQEKLQLTKRLVSEYRQFYRVGLRESSHAILLPLSKALDIILSVPENWDDEELIFQGGGQLYDALERQRQDVYRPLFKDKQKEFEAIQTFMTTCVKDLFGAMCKGDRALLQENRNRIKSGAEFVYRLLALEDKKAAAEEKTEA